MKKPTDDDHIKLAVLVLSLERALEHAQLWQKGRAGRKVDRIYKAVGELRVALEDLRGSGFLYSSRDRFAEAIRAIIADRHQTMSVGDFAEWLETVLFQLIAEEVCSHAVGNKVVKATIKVERHLADIKNLLERESRSAAPRPKLRRGFSMEEWQRYCDEFRR